MCNFWQDDNGTPDDWVAVGAGVRTTAADALPLTKDDRHAKSICPVNQELHDIQAMIMLMGGVAKTPRKKEEKKYMKFESMSCPIFLWLPGGLMRVSKQRHLETPVDFVNLVQNPNETCQGKGSYTVGETHQLQCHMNFLILSFPRIQVPPHLALMLSSLLRLWLETPLGPTH